MIITKLERTLIENARHAQEQSAEFYRLKNDGKATEDNYYEYQKHFHALTVLLTLAHQHDSGLSQEATQQLLEIEDAEAAAYCEREPAADFRAANNHFTRDGQDKTSDSMAAMTKFLESEASESNHAPMAVILLKDVWRVPR